MTLLLEIYHKLYTTFGPQHWWPGDSSFEVAVGAVLTQNTNWGNVEKAILNLKRKGVLSAKALHEMQRDDLAALIRPAGYYNVKAGRLKSFIAFLMEEAHGSMKVLKKGTLQELRKKLLDVNGIGQETADSILLYALEKPAFVIDAYTKRVLSRHGILEQERSYEDFQELFLSSLKREVWLFNEYHALFVRVGKTFCKTRNPLCSECPLYGLQYTHG